MPLVRDDSNAFYPPEMPKKWIEFVERAYDAGREQGRTDVRRPIFDALGLDDALEAVYMNATSHI